jgi:L-iditol 2-dehydrogenase
MPAPTSSPQMSGLTVTYTTPTPTACWNTTLHLPNCPPDGALIKTLGGGLCGTDVEKILQHKVPEGTVLGHEMVGEIIALGANYHPDANRQEATTFAVGDRVVVAHHVPCGVCHYCINASPSSCETFKATNLNPGGFAEFFAISAEHLRHTCFKVPAHIATREAACVEPLACVLRAVHRVGAVRNGSVAVIGLGFIGLLASQVFQQQGWQVLGLDLNPQRLALANVAQYCHMVGHPTEHSEAWQAWVHQLPTHKVDVVCLTVVNAATMAQALTLVRNGGTVLLMAGAGKTAMGLDSNALYYREINVVTSYSPALEDLARSAELIMNRTVSLTPLLTHPLPAASFTEGLEAYTKGEAIKVIFSFDDQQRLV